MAPAIKPYAQYLDVLDEIASERAEALEREYELRCVSGEWLESAVLKLQKPSWTQGTIGEGIFFSVWVGEREMRKGRFNYNIHALKHRLWKGFAIKPGEFAASFRAQFDRRARPNVSVDYGPQTLMQGCVLLDARTFRADVLGLMNRFVEIHRVIDGMIEARRVARE